MSRVDQSGLAGSTRDRPIVAQLESILDLAAREAQIDRVWVYSGGQPGSSGNSIGGPRHNGGRAADLQLIDAGSALKFTNASAPAKVRAFVTTAARLGANGIGAGTDYMGPKGVHVGFGTHPNDTTRIVWGKGGLSANAPAWLRSAAQDGWTGVTAAPQPFVVPGPRLVGLHEIMARSGLNLRKGPGLAFGSSQVLPLGQTLIVLGYHEQALEWAKVDLDGDGVVDGFVFADYLRPVDQDGAEPGK